jgi:hypothetical protein
MVAVDAVVGEPLRGHPSGAPGDWFGLCRATLGGLLAAKDCGLIDSRRALPQTIEQQLERLRTHATEQWWEVADRHVIRNDGYCGGIASHS